MFESSINMIMSLCEKKKCIYALNIYVAAAVDIFINKFSFEYHN